MYSCNEIIDTGRNSILCTNLFSQSISGSDSVSILPKKAIIQIPEKLPVNTPVSWRLALYLSAQKTKIKVKVFTLDMDIGETY